MRKSCFLPIAAVIALSACSANQASQNLASSSPSPEDYRAKVAAYVRETFIDPYSIRDAAISERSKSP